MIYVTLTYILGLLVVILGYTTINLLLKNEKAEDIILSQDKFLNSLFFMVKDSEKKLDELDKRGIFKSDDEIGWLFNEVKKIQDNISNFFKNRNL